MERRLQRWEWIAAAAIVAAVAIAYHPAWHGGFLWDDKAHLTRPDLRSWYGLFRIWFDVGATQQYYPLAHTAFWVQQRLWGDAPAGYHLVTIALHASVAVLVGLGLRRLGVPGAWFAAALFALHPVQVESVAWISELKNTLSGALYLGAALAYLRFSDERSRLAYALSLVLFALALCTKTVTATLPAALLVVAYWQRGRLSWRRDGAPLVPFFALGACAGAVSVWVERKLVGAEGAGFDLSIPERILVAGRAPWFYLAKLVWPAELTFIYPRWRLDPGALAQWAFPAAALASLAALVLLRKRSRAPLAAALFFAGTLFPALGFFNVYPFLFSFVADHFQYLASVGILAFAAAAAAVALRRLPEGARRAGFAAGAAVLALFGMLTFRQSRLYSDAETLYRATLRRNPDCWMAYNNLAALLVARGAAEEAAPLLDKALALRPAYAEAHQNLGLVLRSRGRLEDAAAEFERAIALDPGNAFAHYDLAMTLLSAERPDDAFAHLLRAVELDPSAAAAQNALGTALARRGRSDEALAHFDEAVQLDPTYAEAHNNLGIVLARRGRLGDAVAHFRRALELDPNSAEVRRNLELAIGLERGR